jgi:4-carboxymuconolactone decarboxylase
MTDSVKPKKRRTIRATEPKENNTMDFSEYPGRPWKIVAEAMSAPQRALVEHVNAGPRGRMPPNLSIWLNDIDFAKVVEPFGEYVTQLAPFTKRQKEIVILVNAAYWKSRFEWHFHEALGLKHGLSKGQIEAIWEGRNPGFEDPLEAVSYQLAHALLHQRDVDDALHEKAMQLLGHQGVQDIIAIMGLYSMIAQTIVFYRVPIPTATE